MLIKKYKSKPAIIVWLLLALVLLVVLSIAFSGNGNSSFKTTPDDINEPTIVTKSNTDLKEIILDKLNVIYSDSLVSIHLLSETGVGELMFVYGKNAYPKVLTDNFSTSIVLKDSTKTISGKNRLHFYEQPGIPEEVNFFGKRFIVFKFNLESEDYIGGYIDVENIKVIHTSRHIGGVGARYSIRNIVVDKIVGLQAALPTVTIKLNNRSFKKLEKKRYGALRNGVLESYDTDLVNVSLFGLDSTQLKAQMRLKGDWTQHLEDERKWSFRIIMDGDKTFNGMRKFSLQAPVTRNYLWEWLFQRAVREADIVSLRYSFVNLNLEIESDSGIEKRPIGIMAVEESFDKILIENNRKREGVILALDETIIWGKREKGFHLGLGNVAGGTRGFKEVVPIRVFNQNKVLSDSKLRKQFEVAKNLFEGYRSGIYKTSEVFDMDKLTSFLALTNLFGGHHGLWVFNLRFYYNPISNRLEPICFDSNSGIKLDKVREHPFVFDEPEYKEMLLEKLHLVSSAQFISDLLERYEGQLNELYTALNSEFDFAFDRSILAYNSGVIKKHINPDKAVTAHFIEINKKQITLQIKNLTNHKIRLDAITHKDGRFLSKNDKFELSPNESRYVTFGLNRYFRNAFVSKKDKVGEFAYPKDIAKLKIKYHIAGVNYSRTQDIIPFSHNDGLAESVNKHRLMFASNYKNLGFVEESQDTLFFKSGRFEVSKNIIIPKGKKVVIAAGFELNLTQNASLISFSPLICNGLIDAPVVFTSDDGTGGGVFVSNAAGKSIIEYSEFTNLSNPQMNGWALSGAVNFYDSEVLITNSLFSENRCEDGLNIMNSNFVIDNSIFRDTQSDAFDGDFVTGRILNSTFINSGNDAIDVSGSRLTLTNIEIRNPSDKALSGGEASEITGSNIKIIGGEIGVVSKDLSAVKLTGLVIEDTRLGLSSFQKKTEYGAGLIVISNLTLINNELDYLIENNSVLTIDGVAVQTVSNNIIDQMYGGEYGKSSR